MIVRDFVKVEPRETVTLVYDEGRRDESGALAAAIAECGAMAIEIDISRVVAQLHESDQFWVDPPKSLVAAVQHSIVSIFTVDETYAFRLDHRVRTLFETGPKCSVFKIDIGMGCWNLSVADLTEVEEIGKRIVGGVDGRRSVRVTSPLGTDLHLDISGRECLVVPQVPIRGEPYGISVPLWGEYNWAPIESATHGVAVIDGLTEAGAKMHVVSQPVVMTIESGRVVAVEGSIDAEAFRAVLATDAGAGVVGELGIGGNPKGILGTETEKARLGTVHLGFGSNASYPGGRNRSEVHVDGVIRNATVEVDGQTLIEGGRLTEFPRKGNGD